MTRVLWLVSALVAVAAASPYVIGLYTEDALAASVQAQQKRLEQQGVELELRLTDYRRAWLGAGAVLEVRASGSGAVRSYDLAIDHGPLVPTSGADEPRDMAGWTTALARVRTRVEPASLVPLADPGMETGDRARLVQLLTPLNPIEVDALTTFDGETRARLHMPAKSFISTTGARVNVHEGNGSLRVSKDGDSAWALDFQGLDAAVDAGPGSKPKAGSRGNPSIEVGAVRINHEQTDINDPLSGQNTHMELDSLRATPEGLDQPITLSGLRISSRLTPGHDGLDARMSLDIDSLQSTGIDPDTDGRYSIGLDFGFAGLAPEAAREISAVGRMVQADPGADPALINARVNAALASALNASLKNKPSIAIERLSISRDGAPMMDGQLRLALAEVTENDLSGLGNPMILLRNLSGELAVTLDAAPVRASMTKRNVPQVRGLFEDQGLDPDSRELESMAAQMADMTLAMVKAQGFITERDGMLGIEARLEPGLRLTLNGSAFPLDQFLPTPVQ
ncbi:MAG: DUF945 family protein [Gammaproteobacteria bacterium]